MDNSNEEQTKQSNAVYLMRREVKKFAEEMESVLKENDYKDGWKNCDDRFLEKKLIEEFTEYFLALNHPAWNPLNVIREFVNQVNIAIGHVDTTKEGTKKELVDIANICMMLHDNLP